MTEAFFDRLAELELTMAGEAIAANWARARQLLADEALVGRCFDIADQRWLSVLADAGEFRSPPALGRREDPTGGTLFSFPSWPQARYLVRMAPLAPEQVHETMLSVPETDNDLVHVDLAKAACSLPPAFAADWARREAGWVASRPHLGLNLPDALGGLVVHLAEGGQGPVALELARAMLAVLPDQREAPEDEGSSLFWRPEPRARFEVWTYRRQAELCFPALAIAVGLPALALACELLEEAIRLSRLPDEDNTAEDLSYIWHQGIEWGPGHDFKGVLVCAVRDTGAQLIERDERAVLEAVDSRRYKVFARIGLHLRRQHPDVDSEGTAQLLSNPAILGDVHLQHERFHLLKEQFARLPDEARQTYLAWVNEGPDPDIEEWLDWRERESGTRPSPDDGEKYARGWRHEQLLPVQDALPDDWKRIFEKLKAEFPIEPKHPDYPVWYEVGRGGSESPKSADDLGGMPVAEIVEFLRTWQPGDDPFGPSRDGLVSVLEADIARDPGRYAAAAELFRDADVGPTYVGALLQGLCSAVRQEHTFDWEPVLELARWVVERPREDRDWGWSRRTLTELIPNGFKEAPTEMPFGLRREAWEVLRPLTDDLDPSPEDEARQTGVMAEGVNYAINTTRGRAMEAMIDYALWVRRHVAERSDGEELLDRGFGVMPEVREVLDARLDCDPSLAVRAIYGMRFPWVVVLDAEWARAKAPAVFPAGEGQERGLWQAAWNAYVSYCRLYDNVFEVLRDEYARAVERLEEASDREQRPSGPSEHLAGHLMTLCWRGRLPLQPPDELLLAFYGKASDELRAHAMAFVGRSLQNADDSVPEACLGNMKTLWDWRFRVAKESGDPPAHKGEVAAFGWWFCSGKLDEENWALSRLVEAIDLVGEVDPDFTVVRRLAEVAADSPLPAARCLSTLVRQAPRDSFLHSWIESAKTILTAAHVSENTDAQKLAEDTRNRLGERGHLDLRDLW